VTIDASTPGGMVETITVTANGLNPSGFLPVPVEGQSGQATAEATTLAFVAPVPQIWFNGSNVTNNGQPTCPSSNVACVYIGQKIALTTSIPPPPPGVTVQSYSWSMPQGTVVGGYIPSAQSGIVQPFPIAQAGTCQTLAESCLTFYWVDKAASRTLRVSYTLTNGAGNYADVTLNVAGPTATGPNGAFLTASVQAPPAGTTPAQIVNVWTRTDGPWLSFGKDGNDPGIYFDVTANGPSGAGSKAAFQFVQLINQSAWRHRSIGYISLGGLPLGLDGDEVVRWYPYARTINNPNQALDDPGISLFLDNNDPIGESAVKFGATMYLMWDPALPSDCDPANKVGDNPATPSTCTGSIPVPLGKIDWGFSASAINTLSPNLPGTSNGTGWIMEPCSGPNPVTYSATTAHPIW
jgi:hypothetical protein